MTQTDMVQRYRHLRSIAGEIQAAALELVPHAALIEFGRRLGAVSKGDLCLEDDRDIKLVYDLAIHTARLGRSRAIDRYARNAAFPPGSDEARVLAALQEAKFTIFRFDAPHVEAGAIAHDLIPDQRFHLMDISISLSAQPKASFIGRLVEIEGFRMSCLSVVPILQELLELANSRLPPRGTGSEIDEFQDPRCAIAVYRSAIELGFMRRTLTFDVAKELPTAESVAAVMDISDRRPVDLPRLTLVY